jgi:ParB family chromosome partitioning protein
LGRGLDALIPPAAAALREIPIDRISPSPSQPRQRFDAEELGELAASIRQHGVLQPVVVLRDDGNYVLIAGERRWRAARIAGLASVPAVIKDASAAEALELALIENVQRADLSPLEEAAAYRQLIEEHALTQEQVANRVGKSRAAVTNRLRLLSLPPRALALLADRAISEGHARALLGSPDPTTIEYLARQAANRGLSVRQTEELVRRASAGTPLRGGRAAGADSGLLQIEEDLQRAMGTRVQILRSRRGGRIVFHFYDDEQFGGLTEALLGRRPE